MRKLGAASLCMLFLFLLSACSFNKYVPFETGIISEWQTETPGAQTEGPLPKTESATSSETEDRQTLPTASADEDDKKVNVDIVLSNMTLHDKICQLFIVSPESLTGSKSPVTVTDDMVKQALQEMPVGGILYSKPNFIDKDQVKRMLSDIQRYSHIKLILTCDEEGGRVNRLMSTIGTAYVGPMLSYKDQGKTVAYDNAYRIAADMSSLGFNFDMAPVADVWSNMQNTVIGDRAYSDDFEQSASLIYSAVEGFHAGGVGTTLKHFPGHGDTSRDSHAGAVYITKTLEEIRKNELIPFKAGIEAGSDMVMIGHLILTDADDQPAPFSYEIVTKLLRKELEFDGVVMTDSLQMKAMTDYYSSGEIACRAIGAGVDLLLCPQNLPEAVSALENAVKEGIVSEQRIDESVRRILAMKVERGLLG